MLWQFCQFTPNPAIDGFVTNIWTSPDENPSIKAEAVVEGTVKRLTNFGAFVEVQNGIEGLVHVSQIADKHIKNPNEVLTVGQEVKVKVLEINPTEKRLSLSIKEAGEGVFEKQNAQKHTLD